MKNRKKGFKIIVCCGMIGFVIASLILLSYLLRPVTNSRRNICGFYAEKEDSLDVIFVGGSASYFSWEPLTAWKKYGFTSYNFGLDAIQPQVIKYILEETEKTQSPDLYVVDLRPFQYGDQFSEQENTQNMNRVAPFRNLSDNMKYSKNRYELIENGAPVAEEKWTYHFDIAKYHSNLYAFLELQNWQHIFNKKHYYTKGFDWYDRAQTISFNDTSMITEELALGKEIDVYFKDLLEYCGERELPVLFVVHPYCNSPQDQMKCNYMKQYIERYGFEYFNANDYFYDIDLDVTTDFYDIDHMNLLGADKYTNFFSKYLHENYDFKDKRDEEAYAQWNEDYERWWQEMEQVRKVVLEK